MNTEESCNDPHCVAHRDDPFTPCPHCVSVEAEAELLTAFHKLVADFQNKCIDMHGVDSSCSNLTLCNILLLTLTVTLAKMDSSEHAEEYLRVRHTEPALGALVCVIKGLSADRAIAVNTGSVDLISKVQRFVRQLELGILPDDSDPSNN